MRRDQRGIYLWTLVTREEYFVFAKMYRHSIEKRVVFVNKFYICDHRPAEVLSKWSRTLFSGYELFCPPPP